MGTETQLLNLAGNVIGCPETRRFAPGPSHLQGGDLTSCLQILHPPRHKAAPNPTIWTLHLSEGAKRLTYHF